MIRDAVRSLFSTTVCAFDQDDNTADMVIEEWSAATDREVAFAGFAKTRRPRYFVSSRCDARKRRSVAVLEEIVGRAYPIIANPLTTGSLQQSRCAFRSDSAAHADLEHVEMMDLVDRLSDNWRDAFLLVRWSGYTHQEAVTRLGCSFKTVDRWVQRGASAQACDIALAA